MNERDVTKSPSAVAVKPANTPAVVRAVSYKIDVKNPGDLPQYASTVIAFNNAGMSYEPIANAGAHIGDTVTIHEADALVRQGWQNTAGIDVKENQITAWQDRGEIVITNSPQFPVFNQPVSGQEIAVASNSLTQKTDVLEGIRIVSTSTTSLPSSDNDGQLENNPYLKPQEELQKAA